MIDKRVIERQIRKGKLDASAHQRTLESLPDLSDRVARDTDIEPPHRVAVAPSSSLESASDDELDDDIDDEDEDDEEDDEDEDEAPADDATAP